MLTPPLPAPALSGRTERVNITDRRQSLHAREHFHAADDLAGVLELVEWELRDGSGNLAEPALLYRP